MMDIVIQDTCAMPLNSVTRTVQPNYLNGITIVLTDPVERVHWVLNKIISSHFLGGQYSYLTILSSSDICMWVN